MDKQLSLLPCPFCGDEPTHSVWSDNDYHRIECEECDYSFDYFKTLDAAVNAWNRRAGQALSVQEPVTSEDWNEVDRLCKTIRYLVGIAERGEGRQMKDTETVEKFVLGYVQKLEDKVAAGNSIMSPEQKADFQAELDAAPSVQADAQQKPHVDLPERVVDFLWQQAGLTSFHPDGSQLEKFQAFAQLIKEETLARLPLAAPSQSTQAAEPQNIAKAIHYPDCWDTANYPTLADALTEVGAWFKCSQPHTSTQAADIQAPTDERKAFEEWAIGRLSTEPCTDNDGYMAYSTHCAWQSWKARALLKSPSQEDG